MSDHFDPVIIVGRPRSGTRVVASLLRAAGYFLGDDLADRRLDSMSWYQRFVVPLVTSRFFPGWADDPDLRQLCQERLNDTWQRYLGGRAVPELWGWKYPETLFVLPLLELTFPRMRVIHVIRDGRDVCLSRDGFFQATGLQGDPPGWDPPELLPTARRPDSASSRPTYREFCSTVTFGDASLASWRGIDLRDPVAIRHNRFLIGMQAWVYAVKAARTSGLALGGRYRELRYEELCAEPAATAGELFAWLGVPTAQPGGAAGLIRTDRVGAWRQRSMAASERRDFDAGVAFGTDLLASLGYR